jgi:hypothetical protein
MFIGLHLSLAKDRRRFDIVQVVAKYLILASATREVTHASHKLPDRFLFQQHGELAL